MSTEIPADLSEKMSELQSDSSRPSKFDSVTMNISTELAIAQFSQDPLQKIRHITEAFLFLEEEQRKQIVPEESDRERIEIIGQVCTSLQLMVELPSMPRSFVRRMSIPWNFSDNKGIHVLRMFVLTGMPNANWDAAFKRGLEDSEEKYVVEYFRWLLCATRNGEDSNYCLGVKGQFLNWAMPIVIDLSRKILKAFINGDTWEATLSIMRGKSNASSSSASD